MALPSQGVAISQLSREDKFLPLAHLNFCPELKVSQLYVTPVSKVVSLSCCMLVVLLSHPAPHTPVDLIGCCSAQHAIGTIEKAAIFAPFD